MDGEFDREITDSGWGPTGPYVTLLTQIGSIGDALSATTKLSEKEKKVKKRPKVKLRNYYAAWVRQ